MKGKLNEEVHLKQQKIIELSTKMEEYEEKLKKKDLEIRKK